MTQDHKNFVNHGHWRMCTRIMNINRRFVTTTFGYYFLWTCESYYRQKYHHDNYRWIVINKHYGRMHVNGYQVQEILFFVEASTEIYSIFNDYHVMNKSNKDFILLASIWFYRGRYRLVMFDFKYDAGRSFSAWCHRFDDVWDLFSQGVPINFFQ